MPLNDRIFKLRTAVKMTREQFAEEFGVSRQTRIEVGKRNILSGAFKAH